MKRASAAVLLALSLSASAQEPTDQLGAAVKDGSLAIEIAMDDGRVPVAPGFALETAGRPVVALDARARGGKVDAFCASVPQGALILRGAGLRPDIRVESLTIAEDGTIAEARYRGEGGWSRFVLSLFGGLAKRQLAKLRFQTAIPALLKGELLVPEPAPAHATPRAPAASPAPTPAPVAAAKPAPPSRTELLMRLVDQVRIARSNVTVFGGRQLRFGEALTLTTGADQPLRLAIDDAVFRPEAATGAPAWRVDGTLEGDFAAGSIRWGADRLEFASGALDGGRFRMEEGFAERSEIGAGRLALDLTSGRFAVVSGVEVFVGAPSHLAAREVLADASGARALLDLDITGRTGEIRRQGSRLALADARLTSRGLRVDHGRASGDVEIAFDYRLLYPFVVTYPVPELEPRKVPLEFRGPFTARLTLADVGAGDEDAITGTYKFAVNWPPIERAVFEVVRARWVQEIRGFQKVSFDIEPERFAPCGGECFLARFRFTAAKVGSKRLSLHCAPEGKASLVLDKDARAFLIKGLKTETRCSGILGALVNLVAPLFTKTYEDLVVFRMPEDLPFTIDRVEGREDALEIAGAVSWRAEDTKEPAP